MQSPQVLVPKPHVSELSYQPNNSLNSSKAGITFNGISISDGPKSKPYNPLKM